MVFKVNSKLGSTLRAAPNHFQLIKAYESNVYSPVKAMASKSQSIIIDFTLSVEPTIECSSDEATYTA